MKMQKPIVFRLDFYFTSLKIKDIMDKYYTYQEAL
jgi:hypothetical protein